MQHIAIAVDFAKNFQINEKEKKTMEVRFSSREVEWTYFYGLFRLYYIVIVWTKLGMTTVAYLLQCFSLSRHKDFRFQIFLWFLKRTNKKKVKKKKAIYVVMVLRFFKPPAIIENSIKMIGFRLLSHNSTSYT